MMTLRDADEETLGAAIELLVEKSLRSGIYISHDLILMEARSLLGPCTAGVAERLYGLYLLALPYQHFAVKTGVKYPK